jgi:hypothetical protein
MTKTLAEIKFSENIAEYVLYIWQMQDLLRAVDFDVNALDGFIRSYMPNEDQVSAEKAWFAQLAATMRNENVLKKGSVSELSELIGELNFLHQTLTTLLKDKDYMEVFASIEEPLSEYRKRSNVKQMSDVEMCLTALYGLLMLRLQKKDVSEETQEAMQIFSNWIAKLAKHYHAMKRGESLQQFN